MGIGTARFGVMYGATTFTRSMCNGTGAKT